MPLYEFIAHLGRVPNPDDCDKLFAAGLGDTTIQTGPGAARLNVHRTAPTMLTAILSVVTEAKQAGFTVISVEPEDLITLKEAARRAGHQTASCPSAQISSTPPTR